MSNLKYTKTHEWLLEETNKNNPKEVCIGITEHAKDLLGDVVFVELPQVGKTVKANQTLGVIESVKAAADFYAPIDGVVCAINENLNTNPGLINQSPHKDGWLVKLTVNNNYDISHLLDNNQYLEFIKTKNH